MRPFLFIYYFGGRSREEEEKHGGTLCEMLHRYPALVILPGTWNVKKGMRIGMSYARLDLGSNFSCEFTHTHAHKMLVCKHFMKCLHNCRRMETSWQAS